MFDSGPHMWFFGNFGNVAFAQTIFDTDAGPGMNGNTAHMSGGDACRSRDTDICRKILEVIYIFSQNISFATTGRAGYKNISASF